MVSPYDQISAKLERANKHIADLKGLVDAFRQSDPCSVRCETDEKTGEVSFYADRVSDVPADFSLFLGDALQNLRSALDYAAYFLIKRHGGKTSTQTGFPIEDTPEKYEAAFPRKIPCAGKILKEVIDAMRPYKGGNDRLWQLHRLNNIDKHRLLLTVCVANPARLMTPSEKDSFFQKHGTRTDRTGKPFRYQFKQVVGTPFVPVEKGYKLLTIPIADAKEEMGFVFDIAIKEPDVTEGTPISLLLDFIRMDVSFCIQGLEPLL